MAMRPQMMQQVRKTGRVGRHPKHNFGVQGLPFQLVPFMIAPVLPGETMDNLFFESRVVSDPVLNKLIGWKKEFAFFYVKITDLLQDAIRDMFVDPTNTDLGSTLGIPNNNAAFYEAKGGIPYLAYSYQKIVQHYFRDEGEAWDAFKIGDYATAQIKDTFWMDSLTDEDDMPEGAEIPDDAANATIGELDRLLDAWEQLRALGLAQPTYEDFLRSYGISIPNKDENKPELLARFSDFQYPTNTINPANGAPTSALSWVFKNGERKNKFFKEPGFIIGISVVRPKTYYAGLAGNMAGFMARAWDWMPNYLRDMPETSLKHFLTDTGPLGDRTTAPDGYWADMNDLLMYGDQFQNHTAFAAVPANVGAQNMFALPTGDTFNFKYPTEAMAKSVFVDAGGTAFLVRQDGYVSLSIKGAQRDTTRGNIAQM